MEALKKLAVLFYEGNDETAFNGSNKVVIAEGKVGETLTMSSLPAGVTDAESIVSIACNGNSWTISRNGAYLNDFGGDCSRCDAAEQSRFVDIPAGSFCFDAVEWAVEKGVTTGTGDGTTFNPEGKCIRADVVTFLYRAYTES